MVHCHAGKGRTAMVICAYLIYKQDMSAVDAMDLFKKKRPKSLTKKS